MIARASLGRPWFFRQIRAALEGVNVPPDPDVNEQRECMLRHYRLVLERFGEAKGTLLMRKFACCYAQGIPGSRQFRKEVSGAKTALDFFRVVEQSFPREDADRPSESA
jgi:tRNA-dihydrouridine synthase B